MTSSAETRGRLTHPVIDADAHLLEFDPIYEDYIRDEGGDSAVKAFRDLALRFGEWYGADPRRRAHDRLRRPAFGLPSRSALDLATVMIPRMLYQRLDSFGIDYMIVNPTSSLALTKLPSAELRSVLVRAVNRCHAELSGELSDRLTIAALIPTVTPEEAIAELEYAVVQLGFKVICMDNATLRPIPAFAEKYPDAPASIARHAQWVDTYGLESPYNYDPLWKRCVELGVNPTAHTPAYWGGRASTVSYLNNHLGQFADSGEALLKSMMLGGVTHRFPSLKFGFLEGGVGWACRLYCDLIEHFEKRNPEAMENLHPDHLDHVRWRQLCSEYGGPRFASHLRDTIAETCPTLWNVAGWSVVDREQLNEWKQSGLRRCEDIRDQFTNNFFFGCEADDRTVAWAFDQKLLPLNAKLRPMFGSDIGHWDVIELDAVVHEAHSLVERGHLTLDQFRELTFVNVAEFYSSTNAKFFERTSVASAVAGLKS